MFTFNPESIIPVCIILNWSWLIVILFFKYLFNNSICIELWLLTPKFLTLPSLYNFSKASFTSSGSISVSGLCNNNISKYSVFNLFNIESAEFIICSLE